MTDRRAFLKKAVAASGCGAILSACASLPYVAATRSERGYSVPLAELKERPFVLVEIPGWDHPVFLRPEEGGYQALSLRCTHKSCTVRPSGKELECPCHGSRFDYSGTVLEGPASEDLEPIQVIPGTDRVTIVVAQ